METNRRDNNLILIGMPAVGKSTIGVLVAKRLGYAFVDTDLVIQQKEGCLLPELIRQHGLDGFCKLEGDCIQHLTVHKSVVATGGSVIYRPPAMDHLKSMGTIVYLAIDLSLLSSRLKALDERGVIRRPDQTIAQLYAERGPLYQAYSDIIVDTTGQNPEQVVRSILDLFPLKK